MNIENSSELETLRRELDEARQALTGRTVSCGACEQTTRERDEARAEVERLRETLRTVSDVPGNWQADDEVAYAIDQLCEAAYAFASDKDTETPLEDHKTAKAERVAVVVLKTTIGKRIEAATAGLRDQLLAAGKERDEARAQLAAADAAHKQHIARMLDGSELQAANAEIERLRSLPPERVHVHKVTQTGEHFCATQCEKHKQLEADCDQWRKDYNLQTHKVITCGVAADHPDPKLTLRADYMQWNSPQAERVRALRERADKAEAEIARLRAEEPAQPVTDAEVEAAMWRYRDAAISIGASGDGYGVLAEYGANLRKLIARKVAEASARADALAAAVEADASKAAASIVQAISERPDCSALEDDPDELRISRGDLEDIIANRWPVKVDRLAIEQMRRAENHAERDEAYIRRCWVEVGDALAAYRRGGTK